LNIMYTYLLACNSNNMSLKHGRYLGTANE
jgi:hypothetical protein